jgi:hypothetical protein
MAQTMVRISTHDAEMGGDDKTGSNYDSEDVEHLPEISSLILLETHHCRALAQVKLTNGTNISCACGKLGSKCGCHKDREGYRCNPGYYVRMSNPYHGFKGHGKIGVYYTKDQYAELRRQENTKIYVLVASQRDGISDYNEEAAELSREAGMSFGSSDKVIKADGSLADQTRNAAKTPEEIRASLEATTGGQKKSRFKPSKSSKANPTATSTNTPLSTQAAVDGFSKTLTKSVFVWTQTGMA